MLLATNNPKPVALKDFGANFEKSSGDKSESRLLFLSFTLTMT